MAVIRIDSRFAKAVWSGAARRRATLAALLAVVVAAGFAWLQVGPFLPLIAPPADASVWYLVFSDQLTLGFVRLGILLLAVYIVMSVPALVIQGRWLRTFGTGGLTADDAAKAAEGIEQLKKQVTQLTNERDTAIAALRVINARLSQASIRPKQAGGDEPRENIGKRT